MSSPSLKRTIVTFKETSKSKNILTPECVQFLETIHDNTSLIKSEMIHNRKNKKLDFREDTKSIRNSRRCSRSR